MRTIRTTLAAMLTVLTLAAFQSDVQAQTRRSTTTSRTSSSNDRKAARPAASRTTTRKSATRQTTRPTTERPAATRPTTTRPTTTRPAARPSTTVTATRPAETRPAAVRPTTRPTSRPTTTRPATRPTVKPSTGRPAAPSHVTRPAPPVSKPVAVARPGQRPADRGPGDSHHPPRIHPRDRDFMHYSAPSYFWTGHNHCYGHRVRVIPSYAHRHVHYGVTYYCHNDIWYRPFGGYYVVCRPPYGTVLAANLIADMAWTAVRLSYYSTIANTFSQINENNEYIAQQNALIAQNNAVLAAQNAQMAAGQTKADEAFLIADKLGLVQSYADAGSSYFYQDGVFYMSRDGQYQVILPPAGALVETLPEDYDIVTLNDGKEYYKVDDTVYRVSVSEGKPMFEVLGQLYS